MAVARMGSHKRKSKPVKLQKLSAKPVERRPSSIQQSKPTALAQSPGAICSTPSPLQTTETMIRSIPDLFKNASIGTETQLSAINGSTSCGILVKDNMACAESNNDVTSQISTSVLPPFSPPVPPERFNMPTNDQQYCCLDCGDQFRVESSLTQHLQRRSIYITFNCATCKKLLVFYNRCTLLGHVRVHHDRSQVADIQQASISPLPHELIQCIQEQKLAGAVGGSPKANLTPVVTIIIPPNSDNILTVTKPIQKQASKCKCPECHYQCGSFLSLQEHLGCGQTSSSESGAQCPQCNMVCPSRCSLLCHQRIHEQTKPYLCPECGQNVTDEWDDFQRHLAIECMHYSRTIGFKCPACNLLVVTPEQLRHHVISTHSESYYKCQACPMAFRAEGTFEAHRKAVHNADNLQCTTIRKCPLCEVVFQSNDVLKSHLESHFQEALKTSKFLFMCLECNQLFEEKTHLGQHLHSNHSVLFDNGVTEDPTDKRQLKLPRKRARSSSKSKSLQAKVPELVIPKLVDQNSEPFKAKVFKTSLVKSQMLKVNQFKPSDLATKEHFEGDQEPRREPRIPPLVLSLKDCAPNNANPSLIIKKLKSDSSSNVPFKCEDCGRKFTTEIGCRVHRQRSHTANYKFKNKFRQTLERRCRRPIGQERIHSHKSAEPVEEATLTKSSVEKTETQCARSDVPSESDRQQVESTSKTTCNECGRSFLTSQGCSKHRKQCRGSQDNVKSKCAVCQQYYHDPHTMAEHGQKHLKEGMLVCTLCNNLVFSTKLALSKHIENHASNMSYPVLCALCNEELGSAETAVDHWRKEHGLSSFHCPHCDAQYLLKKSLNRHIHAAHGIAKTKQVHRCNLCDTDAFLTSELLKTHMMEEHSNPRDAQDVVAETEVPGEAGADISEPHEVVLKSEPASPEAVLLQVEQEPKPHQEKESIWKYSCAKCDFKSNDRPVFQTHIADHKTETDSYQCLECGTSFVVEPSLRMHLKCSHKVKDLETFMVERGYNIGLAVNNGDLNDGVSHTIDSGQSDGGKVDPLACTICFLSCENELALKTHSRTHGMAFIRSKRNTCTNSPASTPTKDEA